MEFYSIFPKNVTCEVFFYHPSKVQTDQRAKSLIREERRTKFSEGCSHLLVRSAIKLGYQTERSFPTSSGNPTVVSQLFLDPEGKNDENSC